MSILFIYYLFFISRLSLPKLAFQLVYRPIIRENYCVVPANKSMPPNLKWLTSSCLSIIIVALLMYANVVKVCAHLKFEIKFI